MQRAARLIRQAISKRPGELLFFQKRKTWQLKILNLMRKENKPILYACHDEEDGAWQFLAGEPVEEKDVMVVGLEEVVEYDPTIKPMRLGT